MEKQKMSAFELVFLQIADPEKAKEYEPYTKDEERVIRAKKMEEKLSTLIKCRDGSVKPLKDCIL